MLTKVCILPSKSKISHIVHTRIPIAESVTQKIEKTAHTVLTTQRERILDFLTLSTELDLITIDKIRRALRHFYRKDDIADEQLIKMLKAIE